MSYVDVEFMTTYVGLKYNYISSSYGCSMNIRALMSRGLEFHFWFGNISSGNQPIRANYRNFNPNHTILIQRRTHERWEG
jgi:hypothetical protein